MAECDSRRIVTMADLAMCPDCQVMIPIPGQARKNKRFECPECQAEVEIISIRPLRLDFAYDEQEWNTYDDDDDLWDEDDFDGEPDDDEDGDEADEDEEDLDIDFLDD
jgi:hypothetical protein